MSKGKILGIVWFVLIAFTAWWAFKNLKPSFLS